MRRRPKQPADDAPAEAWNEYDAKVIEAFLREAADRLDAAPEAFPGKVEHARLTLHWLSGRVGRVSRGVRT